MKNKRKYRRVYKDFMVRFRVKPDETKKKEPIGWDIVTTSNLSAGGMLFNYDKNLPIGTKIELRIIFPMAEGTINCIGKVLRANVTSKDAQYSICKIAAIFEKIRKDNQQLIERAANVMYA